MNDDEGSSGLGGWASRRKWWQWVLMGFAVLVVMNAIARQLDPEGWAVYDAQKAAERAAYDPEATREQQDAARTKRELEDAARSDVDVSQIIAAFDTNELAAERQFGDVPLRVQGVVLNIDAGLNEGVSLRVGRSDQQSYQGATAEIDKEWADWSATLRKGQEVTLLCSGAGEMMSLVFLDDCVPEQS